MISDVQMAILKTIYSFPAPPRAAAIASESGINTKIVFSNLGAMLSKGLLIKSKDYYELSGKGMTEMMQTKSALTQNEKTHVETIEPAPIVAESVLEQIQKEVEMAKNNTREKADETEIELKLTSQPIHEPEKFENFEQLTKPVGSSYFSDSKGYEWTRIKPSHYQGKTMQVFDVLKAFMSDEQLEGFYRGNVVKYVLRYPHKSGTEDLKKSRVYLDKLIEVLEHDD